MNQPIKTDTKQPWIVLVMSCFLSSASIGFILNTIGLFYSPVAKDLGILTGEFSLHFTICSISIAVFSLTVPIMFNKVGFKPTLTIGVILAFIGTAGMAFTEQLWAFYLLGAIRGIGASFFCFVPVTILVNNWFEKSTGLALSIMNASAGLIGVVFSPILTWVITSYGWKIAFIVNGFLIVLFALPALLYPYTLKPVQSGYVPHGHQEQEDTNSDAKAFKMTNMPEFSFTDLAFISLLIFSILHSAIVGISSHLPGYGLSVGLTSQTAGLLMSSLMLGNIIFKLVIGQLSDKIGVEKTTVIMIVTNFTGVLLLALGRSLIILSIGSFLFGSVYAIAAITFPLLSIKYFGVGVSNRILPFMIFVTNMGTALSIAGVGYLFDFTGTYFNAFVLAMIFHLINLLMVFIGRNYTSKKASPL